MLAGLFGLFGKSRPMTALERALREAGLHPALAPDPVKLTVLRLLGGVSETPPPERLEPVAELLAYCLLGERDFAAAAAPERVAALERRLEAVLEAPESIDARIVMLTLTSGEAHPDIEARFDMETGAD